ncbi:MAG: cystathionine gamma-synthase [Flavobacteriales bacterium]|nr:cystathionine gamma-synthase [Flavobacteriales bacterium]
MSKFGTKAIHAGAEPDSATGAIMTPIYQTSTYIQNAPGEHKGYEYSRTLNPTRHALEKNLAALENGNYGLAFSSGLAAMDALLKTFKPGDEIISSNDLYGGSYRLFTKIFSDLGLKFRFVEMDEISKVESLINAYTKMIWIETPTNPMMNIIDIKAVSNLAIKHNILSAVDNTFSSPYLQNPLDLGADVVVHSITKFIAGHSDVVMGAIVLNDDTLANKLYFIQNSCGAVPGPQDCFLVLRGIKTLHVRMDRHCQNAIQVASFLKNHPKVESVFYPGLSSHPNHEVAVSQMNDFGGMISFITKGNRIEDAKKVITSTKIFSLAESLGGVESLCGHPATMTHAAIPKEEREKSGVVDALIRLSVGIEDVEDLIEDLSQALEKI